MTEKIVFDYYTTKEIEQITFIRVPKVLITGELFKNLNPEAKLLYGVMQDRASLSLQNKWIDKNNRVYIYFTIEEVKNTLCCKNTKATNLIKELEVFGLIEKQKQGQGKPTKIYVKNPSSSKVINKTQNSENQNSEKQNSQKQNSENKNSQKQNSSFLENGSLEFRKSECNNTDINKTDINNTDDIYHNHNQYQKSNINIRKDNDTDIEIYKKKIRENIELEKFSDFYKNTAESLYEIMCSVLYEQGLININDKL